MTDTVDPRSEEPEPIIVRLREIIDDAQVTSHYEEAIDIAVQAIKDLIATEVLHARRDEVERFLVEPGEAIPYNNNTFADGFRYVIDKLQARLAELEAQLENK
jgi:hypothetical protein